MIRRCFLAFSLLRLLFTDCHRFSMRSKSPMPPKQVASFSPVHYTSVQDKPADRYAEIFPTSPNENDDTLRCPEKRACGFLPGSTWRSAGKCRRASAHCPGLPSGRSRRLATQRRRLCCRGSTGYGRSNHRFEEGLSRWPTANHTRLRRGKGVGCCGCRHHRARLHR